LAARKTGELTDLGNKHARFSLTMYPATLKALSDGTDVAGIQRYFLTMRDRIGKCCPPIKWIFR